jgi:hypothetical protein
MRAGVAQEVIPLLIKNAQKSQGDSEPVVAWNDPPRGLDNCSLWDTHSANEFGRPIVTGKPGSG